ncbi:MAG: hypothetical protein JWR60_2411, partial [Polaromonas sp.]|nr:hypothetical protein [Polaromonas sp.]
MKKACTKQAFLFKQASLTAAVMLVVIAAIPAIAAVTSVINGA